MRWGSQIRQATVGIRARVARRPTLFFGVPFVLSMVLGSFAMTKLTETRYIQHDVRVRAVSKEESLRLKRDRKPLDIREEYFKLESQGEKLDDWEPKRVARPAGMPEWGGVPAAPPPGSEPVAADTSGTSRSSFFARRRPLEAEERPDGAESTPPPPAHGRPPTVLGPDGKPCRACNTKVAFGAALRAASASTAAAHKDDACPPDITELGHATWTFLHSAAAYYPDAPSAEQRAAMRALLDALPHVYPCSMCAEELREEYQRPAADDAARAAAVSDGAALRRWVCELHNGVNARLGKPLWDCADATRLRHRWYEPPEDKDC